MNTPYTPGPWINDGTEICAYPDPENSKSYIAPVCFMEPNWDAEIGAFNARLIAAAPDLMRLLIEMEDWAEQIDDEESRMPCALREEARAILATIRGARA